MRPPVSLAQLESERVKRSERGSLHAFMRFAWPRVERSEFIDNWHLELLCDYLERVSAGEITRLVINVPPGTGKSLTVSVFWPLWEWIFRPHTKWMYASYSPSLSASHGQMCINLLQSRWWQQRFSPRLVRLKPAASDFTNTDGGRRFATSPGGTATGIHGDIQVCDDPIKPQALLEWSAVQTQTALRAVSVWWRQTMSTRKANPATFRRVIVMQRLHELDLAQEMLGKGWAHVHLPMRYDRKTYPVCTCHREDCTPEDPRTRDGELLFPARFPEEVVKQDETVELGESVASAQYQQRPALAGGHIFKKHWHRYWHHREGVPTPHDPEYPCRDDVCAVLPDMGEYLQSWDFTFAKTTGSDFVAGGVWLWLEPNAYLVHCVNARMSFVEMVEALLTMTGLYPQAYTKIVEYRANGPAVMSMLEKKVPGLVPFPEPGEKFPSKESRQHATSGLFQAGNVYVPHPDLAPWVPAYLAQLSAAPKGVHDDMVDMTTQLLIRVAKRGSYLAALERMKDGLR